MRERYVKLPEKMVKKVINSKDFFSDIEQYRTPREMWEYFEQKKIEISDNLELRSLARFKTGRFKEFLEEFYPLVLYSQSNYFSNDAEIRMVIGNQPYDGLIKLSSGEIQKVEVTQYLEGYLDRLDAIMLKERGYSELRIHDTKDLQSRADLYLDKVVENAANKASKDYEGVIILIVVNTFFYLDLWNIDAASFIQRLINRLRELPFNSDSLYIITLNNDPVENINNNIYKAF